MSKPAAVYRLFGADGTRNGRHRNSYVSTKRCRLAASSWSECKVPSGVYRAMANLVLLGTAGLLMAVSATACGNPALNVKEGDCLHKSVEIVPCDSPEADSRVSAILPPGREEACPKDPKRSFTETWVSEKRTVCVLSL